MSKKEQAKIDAVNANAELSAKLTPHVLWDETGHASVSKDVFIENLPEGLTPAIVKLVRQNDVDYSLALRNAGGQAALEKWKSDSDSNKLSLTADLLGASYNSTFTGKRTAPSFHNPSETTTHYGSVTDSLKLSVPKKGHLASGISKELAEKARNLLGE